MKKTIKRMVEQEVEVCDRCETKMANHRFIYYFVDAGKLDGQQKDIIWELCDTCRAVIENSLIMTRRKRTPAES